MKSKCVLIAVSCLLSLAGAQGQRGVESQKPRALVYTLEGLGALGGAAGCGGLCVGTFYLASLAAGPPGDQDPGFLFWAIMSTGYAALALPAVAGIGVAKVGKELHENGSQTLAIGGAYAGLPLAVGAFVLGARVGRPAKYHGPYGWLRRSSSWEMPLYVLGALAIPIGAVVGYNLGPTSHGVGGRFQLPAMALTSAELPDHSVEYGVKVQLAGLKF